MKIIFIDNSEIILETLRMLMKNIVNDFEISFYRSPLDIKELHEADKLEFDILFSEIIFKELDGMELIKAIKTSQKHKDKRVSIITKEHNRTALDALELLNIGDIFIKSIYSGHLESFLQDVITAQTEAVSP